MILICKKKKDFSTRICFKRSGRTESGHTLMEMLGVLAVIGILSVVGFRLYAKAMNTLRVNHVMDQVLIRHVELANKEESERKIGRSGRSHKSHKMFDIERGDEETKLAYGYEFGDVSADSITVDGVFSKGACNIFKKRIQDVDYHGLNDIKIPVDGKRLSLKDKDTACPDEVTSMTFLFGAAALQVKPDDNKPVKPASKCKDFGNAFGAVCTPLLDEDCCIAGLMCQASGTCTCDTGKEVCKGKCYDECESPSTRNWDSCMCEDNTPAPAPVPEEECPSPKPSSRGASCTYIGGENCCDAEKGLTCSAEGKCVCTNSCTAEIGGQYTGEQNEDCSCETCPEGKTWNGEKCEGGTGGGTGCVFFGGMPGARCTISTTNCCDGSLGLTCNAEGKCTCDADQEWCKTKCRDACIAEIGGQYTGRRNADCSCETCPEGETWNGEECVCEGENCQCQAGYVLKNDRCVRRWCDNPLNKGNDGYDCYIDDGRTTARCGTACTSTNMDKDVCYGYCSDFCPTGSTWGNTTVTDSGLGCKKNGGLYCATIKIMGGEKRWVCKREDNANSPICCQTKDLSDFGKCYEGTCDASQCEKIEKNLQNVSSSEYVRIGRYVYGCKITYTVGTGEEEKIRMLYCLPNNGNQWSCYFDDNGNGGSFAACGTASTVAGAISKCNSAELCRWGKYDSRWSKWNEDTRRCRGTVNGQGYECGYDAVCYRKNTKGEYIRCGDQCTDDRDGEISPSYCKMGICNAKDCSGGAFVEIVKGYYGCASGGYAYVKGMGCYYKKSGESEYKICGYGATNVKGCSSCTRPVMPECAGENKCLTDGSEINGCICPGSASAGHCCLAGHVYVNGACSQVDREAGKCLYGSKMIDSTNEYADSTDSVLCTCKGQNKCMVPGTSVPRCVSKTESYTANSSGLCQCLEASKCLKRSGTSLVCEDCSASGN